MARIRPYALDPLDTITQDAALVVDNGTSVGKVDPARLVNFAVPMASQEEAEAGTANDRMLSPLRLDQVLKSTAAGKIALADGGALQDAIAVAADPASLIASTASYVAGSTIRTADGFIYLVADPNATDQHLTTAGGVRLYVKPAPDNSFNLAQFGPSGDISAILQKAIAIAGGRKIVIPAGSWTALNVDVTGAWLEFSEGAKISATLGATDNLFTTEGGTRLVRPVFEVTNTASPSDGGYGNIITMGSYVTDGAVFDGLEIVDGAFTSLNPSAYGLAISCLGRCENVRLRGKTRLVGRFAGGFQAHWGGVFDGADPHSSNVSESYHPNNISIETLSLEKGGPSTLGGHLGLSLSAAYDVDVGTIINAGWDRTDWIQPGDVYDLVAAPDQKDKIMSGIRVRYTEIINPVANTSTYNNILMSGVSATIRVSGQTAQVCAADRQNMAVDHGEVRVICEPGYSYTTGPIARMLYAKNSKISVTFQGFAWGITSSLFQSVASTDCDITVAGADDAPLLSGFNNVKNRYAVRWKSPYSQPSNLNATHRVVAFGGSGGTATVSAAVAAGATSIPVSSWAGVSDSIVPKGLRLYLPDRSWVTLSRSQSLGPSTTSIDVERLQFAISSGAQLLVQCRELGSVIDGYIEGGYTPIELTNVDGVSVPAHIRRSGKYDVLLSGDCNRRVLFNGIYDECGQLNDGSLLVNIHLGSSGVRSEYVTARGARFEQSGATPLVSNNVYGRMTNNAHIGLVVTDCDLNSTSFPVNYLWPTDAATLNAGPPQVFGNRRSGAMLGTAHDFDPVQGACMSVGGVWYVLRNAIPGAGDWPLGSKWVNTNPAAGQPKGSIRTATGWVSEGNL